jgi:hypothetical protein
VVTVSKSRFGLVLWQKAVLWIAALLCVWRFLENPVIFDAILNFYAAGEVPGTDMVLSPDAMLRLVFIVCVAGAVAIFWKLFVFGLIVRAARALHTTKPAASPAPAVQQLRPVALPAKPVRPAQPSWFRKAGRRVADVVRTSNGRVRQVTAKTWNTIRPRLAYATTQLWRFIRQAARFTVRMSRITATFIALIAMQVWDWIEPRFRSFDNWLELHLNQNEVSAAALDFVRRTGDIVTDLWKKAVALTNSRLRTK